MYSAGQADIAGAGQAIAGQGLQREMGYLGDQSTANQSQLSADQQLAIENARLKSGQKDRNYAMGGQVLGMIGKGLGAVAGAA